MMSEPTTLEHIAREIPRRRVALVLLIVLVNLGVATYRRGYEINDERFVTFVTQAQKRNPCMSVAWPVRWIAPSEWTADEWRETVWPWK